MLNVELVLIKVLVKVLIKDPAKKLTTELVRPLWQRIRASIKRWSGKRGGRLVPLVSAAPGPRPRRQGGNEEH